MSLQAENHDEIPTPAPPTATPAPESEHAAFARGYRDAGGPEALLAHVLADVLPCESSGADYIDWTPRANGYISAAQFHPGSWASARRVGDADPADPYEVGYAVGRWLGLIGPESAGTRAGWLVCWWRGVD